MIRISFSILLSAAIAVAQQTTIRTRVDLVVVPVSVRDSGGKPVYDLEQKDFFVFEDGRAQSLSQFSIDPAPLSVAVVVDTGIGGTALRRFVKSIVTLASGFTDADEAEVYRFDSRVLKLSDFTQSKEQIEATLLGLQKLAEGKGDRSNSPFLVLPGRGPRWLRWLLDIGADSRVLNDALFAAAVDLEHRPNKNRKVIVVVSDGQVAGKTVHSLEQTRERLTQSQIQFYGVTVGMALLEGSTSILKSYAESTGGDVYGGRTINDMESALARITTQARHQYVLSYVSNNEIPGLLPIARKIEIKASRPGLKINHRKRYLQYPQPR
jgi:VWFA-related protein